MGRKNKGNNYEIENGIVYMKASNHPDVIFTFLNLNIKGKMK